MAFLASAMPPRHRDDQGVGPRVLNDRLYRGRQRRDGGVIASLSAQLKAHALGHRVRILVLERNHFGNHLTLLEHDR